MRVALIGYGNVARAFARLLERQRAVFPFRIVGAHTRHGTAIDTHGLPVEPRFAPPLQSVEAFLEACAAEVAIEVTTLSPLDGEPAISHIRAALARGLHVITANKGPVAVAYHDLKEEARRRALEFRHEPVTMDGTPVFNLVRNNLPGVTVKGFAGA